MLTKRIGGLEERLLKKFRIGKKTIEFKDRQEIQVFQILQRFDLIRAGASGVFKITSKGEYALGVGVKRYLTNLRLEKKLFKDYMRAKSHNRWFMVFGIVGIALLVSVWYLFN